jgi:hypothetical protein
MNKLVKHPKICYKKGRLAPFFYFAVVVSTATDLAVGALA